MKVKFSKFVDYIPEWNKNRELPEEDQIKSVICPMEIGDLINLMESLGLNAENAPLPALESGQPIPTPAATTQTITIVNYNNAIQGLKKSLPKYIKVTNMTDELGEEITLDLIISYGMFMPLSVELLMQAIQVSIPGDTAEGNSAKPLAS